MKRDQGPILGLLLVLTLCAHTLILAWLHQQALGLTPVRVMADPLFTRLIEPEQPVAVVPPQRPVRALARAAPVLPVPVPTGQPDEGLPAMAGTDLADQPTASEAQPLEPPLDATPERPDGSTAAPFDNWPADTRVSYDLRGYYRGDLHGSAKVQWQRQQNRYQVRIDLSMALLLRVSMISQGQTGELGLLPEVYEEQLLWGQRRLLFEGDRVSLHNGDSVARPQGVQDAASQFVELSQRFSSGRQVLRLGAQVELWLARPEGLALWTYDVVDEEWLELPELGRVAAFRLRPRPIANPTGVIAAEIWFAPALKYLPVRIRISLGANNVVDLWAERVEQGVDSTSAPTPTIDPQPVR